MNTNPSFMLTAILLLSGLMGCSEKSAEPRAASPTTEKNIPTTTEEESMNEDETPLSPEAQVKITAPATHTSYVSGENVSLTGTVEISNSDSNNPTYKWLSDKDGLLFENTLAANGNVGHELTSLSVGYHTILLQAWVDEKLVGEDQIRIGICGWASKESFDAPLSEDAWLVTGDAYRDERGWLEMTGNVRTKRGAIFNVAQQVSPGDFNIRFKIATGQCDTVGPCGAGNGADGFALSVFNVADPTTLETLLSTTNAGGGLGYGVGNTDGSGYGDWEGAAFHIEFDTFHNTTAPGHNHLHDDPVTADHIAITLNGDPGTHHLWGEIPDLEDNRWHDMEVRMNNDAVVVKMDGTEIISGTVPGLTFKGGFIGFSGTTGWFTNYHRFDELEVEEACRF